MRLEGERLRLAATDLANHLACRHLTELDRGKAEGRWKPPTFYRPEAEVLAQRGNEHEKAFLVHLEEQGTRVARLDEAEEPATALERTLAAMRAGEPAIAQASLQSGRWFGRADLLLRVDRPSELGAWSYEPLDTKLARETRPGAILQLCLYADLLCATQGTMPETMYVAPRRPDFPVEPYRVADYLAYYRLVRRRLEAALEAESGGELRTYPEPTPHCEICRWWPRCDKQRRGDDHLSLVAGVSRLQMRELQSRDIRALARLAAEPLPIGWKPSRGAKDGYVRVREQARIQLAGRTEEKSLHELLACAPGQGLARLPEPSPGDVFLDLEADPFVDDGGLEYLFGWVAGDMPRAGTLALELGPPAYHCRWALDRGAEKRGFEAAMDAILERWAADPGMHVYHFAAYEPGALKRLMGRHATREADMDRMLRAGRFVDLHLVVRQALRASVEEYSIKKLEPLYGFVRQRSLEEAGSALRLFQRGLELGQAVSAEDDTAKAVEEYNRDDCLSAKALRDWLEKLRSEAIAAGEEIARPPEESGAPPEDIGDREAKARALGATLMAGVPDDPAQRTDEERARALLAHLLDWHRREEKAGWWEYYRLRELPDDALLDETRALSGLEFVSRSTVKRSVVDRYRFPAQETSIRKGDKLNLPLPDGRKFGEVVDIDQIAFTVDIKKSGKVAELHPTSVFEHDNVPTDIQWQSLMRLGAWVADHGVDAAGAMRAARDLLLHRPPRIHGHSGGALEKPGENGVQAAMRLALALDETTLAIQGPPGSGKTYTGARMICELLHRGLKVGVCAQSHKVIRNLLEAVIEASEKRIVVRCMQKLKDASERPHPRITEVFDNDDALNALASGTANVVGGTAWLWARDEFTGAVDVLFVDEAGQMSLANALAIAPCARSVVLLGDPQQLEQPIQGLHPDGSAVSALEHVLQGSPTIAGDRGLFLEETWRLPPQICRFTSEVFYEDRLHPQATTTRQQILGSGGFDGAGLWYVPVEHDANQSASREEVEAIKALVADLLRGGATWRDRNGGDHELTLEDILVIAPYNAQVADLTASLPAGVRVGTVDRFQGQEAPVVIYSMTTSTPEDAPRGMEFLYNPNRLNVATSRAMCACIVVGSRRLFEPDCSSPRQMKLANGFCRMLEMATEVSPAAPGRPALKLVPPEPDAGPVKVS
jgi:predicted RecB family nuclease